MQFFGPSAPRCPQCGKQPAGCKRLANIVLNGGTLDDDHDDGPDDAPVVNEYAAPLLTANCPTHESGVSEARVSWPAAADDDDNILPTPTLGELLVNEARAERQAKIEAARKQAARGDDRARREYQRVRREHETEAARLTANAGLPENVLPDPGPMFTESPLW